jgi:hypothetical protein
MGNDNECPGVFDKRDTQRLAHFKIEVVGWLIEQ